MVMIPNASFHCITGWYEDNWYEVNLKNENISCTKEQMRMAAQGHLTTEALMWNQNNQKTISGMSSEDFRTIVRRVLRTVSLPLFICMSTVSSCGIVVALALIVFNIWHRHRRVIQTSHPVCNTIMLFGVIICLVSVILLGLDGQFVTAENYPKVCQARTWILSMGFTLAYGAMFSKVWRVHRFTTKTKTDPKKKVEPWKLYTMVSGLLAVDLVILLTWQLQDPLQRRLETFPLEDPVSSNDDVKIRPELEHCESHNNSVWLGVIYGFKGLILVFGLFLAYETRSIKVKQINDSRYVGMSIYNVVVLCLITAPVAMVIEVLRHPKDKVESKFSNETGISKEDEERYQKLVTENDDLQKLIAQKEDKIRLLKQRLVEKESTVKSGQTQFGDGHAAATNNNQLHVAPSATAAGVTQGKEALVVSIQPDQATSSDFDSAIGGVLSIIEMNEYEN
ncbi:GABA-B receptor [Culex quinquefasciatus]|uniref:GABA-B receptor n=1 Tax=Culex quinquefasciatus TaxID=7176 RepID=B0X1Y6_CULQU|nr:GABA-B receptor [Culex quinquefasciatus]|eukprot:XP_001863658.1 GABA-B receptor [Culex quinquefasciatus]